MARRRMIDPNFWQSEDISKLSLLARYLFIGMLSNADDEGKGRANSNYLKSIVFPYDDMRVAEVDKALSEISHNTSVQIYEVEGNRYYIFTHWSKWQRVEKPQKSTIPNPDTGGSEPFQSNSGMIPESVGNDSGRREEKRREDNNTLSPRVREGVTAYSELMELAKRKCPELASRQQEKIDAGNIKSIAMIEELLYALGKPAEEYEALFTHTARTYVVKPRYRSCDMIWVLDNIPKVLAAPEDCGNAVCSGGGLGGNGQRCTEQELGGLVDEVADIVL